MKKEYKGYEYNYKILDAIYKKPDSLFNFLPKRSLQAYEQYLKHF